VRKLFTVVILLVGSQLPGEPLYENSVVSNDLEFIRTDDPSSFESASFLGRKKKEMLDKRGDELFDPKVYAFKVTFKDKVTTEIWAHRSFDNDRELQKLIGLIGDALGKLPPLMRRKLSHVVLHQGDEVAFGEEEGHFFVLYSENAFKRVKTHDLEETIFHEAAHATLEKDHAEAAKWLEAQRKDGGFITKYAARLPLKEDLPESALFAYALLKFPGRLPAKVEASIREVMPNRLAYFEALFAADLKKEAKADQ
jgi:hypothetical protein